MSGTRPFPSTTTPLSVNHAAAGIRRTKPCPTAKLPLCQEAKGRTMDVLLTSGSLSYRLSSTSETRGSTFDYFWQARDASYAGYLEGVRATLARDAGQTHPPTVVVHGHSHLWHPGFVPSRDDAQVHPEGTGRLVTVVSRGATPVVLNTGAWQRTVTPFQIEEVIREKGSSGPDLLRDLQPEQLSGCYGVVWVEPYSGNPIAQLRFWRADRRWGAPPRDAAALTNGCPARS